MGGGVRKGKWWHLGTDLALQSHNAGKKHEKNGRRFKIVESGLPSALAGSAMHVRELQERTEREK